MGQFPPVMGRRARGRAPIGLLVTAAIAIVLAVGFDLNAIASIGSAIALVVFALVSVGHLRVRRETGARVSILLIGIAATVIVLVTFVLTTLVHEPKTLLAILVVVVVSVGIDVAWKRSRSTPVAVT